MGGRWCRRGGWKLRVPALSLADCFALSALEAEADVLLTTDAVLKEAAGRKGVLFRVE